MYKNRFAKYSPKIMTLRFIIFIFSPILNRENLSGLYIYEFDITLIYQKIIEMYYIIWKKK